MRSYRELWLWLGGLFLTLFLFLAAIAVAYFAKGTHYSLFLNGWMLAALICFLASCHDKSRMIPSSGGAELLGPEYENQADQQGDARQASA